MGITPGNSNVFEDLGFDAAEAESLKVRADLMLKLRHLIETSGWTHAQAAEFFGEPPSHIASLIAGDIDRFSSDALITMLARAGLRVTLHVGAA